MSRGGARARSGPAPDPASGRSAKRGLTFRILPAEGYQGKIPEYPFSDEALGDEAEYVTFAYRRELEVWADIWRSPQACAWIEEPWRWRMVAMYVRWSVRMELGDFTAGLAGAVLRCADQIGLTPDGLTKLGWQIGKAPADDVTEEEADAARQALKVLDGLA